MKYIPNFKDPRVLKRVKRAYGYTLATFDNKEKHRSMETLTKYFGQAQHPLSQYLNRTLLTCTNNHYSDAAGISMKYVVNIDGAMKIDGILHENLPKIFTHQEISEVAKANIAVVAATTMYSTDHKIELNSGEFVYQEKSDRYWHPIQSARKEIKHRVFDKHQYRHNYDIECAAPRLLYQHALTFNDTPLVTIEDYITNKTSVRQQLADDTGIDVKTIKKVINGIFNGAKLGCNKDFHLFNELDNNYIMMNRLKDNEYIQLLKADIAEMWKTIPIKDRRSSREKAEVYRQIEKKVLTSIKRYLNKNNNKHFTEHDGWVCEYEIDEYQLQKYVKEHTGYVIAMSHDVIANI